MHNFFQRKTYQSWQEIETRILLNNLIIVKEKISEIDPLTDDFALTGNLLIDLYEISEEVEKRLLLV